MAAPLAPLEEYVGRMLAYRFEVCAPGEVAEVAGALGWRAGLRRISSLAQALAETPEGHTLGFDVDPRWTELGPAARRGDDWIHLAPLHRTGSPPASPTKTRPARSTGRPPPTPWPPRCRHEPPDEPAQQLGAGRSGPAPDRLRDRRPPTKRPAGGVQGRDPAAGLLPPRLAVLRGPGLRLDPRRQQQTSHTALLDRVLKAASRAYGTSFDTKWGANKLNIYWELPNATTGVIYTDVKPRHHPGAPPTAVLWAVLDRNPQIDTANPILGYSPASMLAAKLECIADPRRLVPRDYYDLHRLLQDPSIDTGAALDEFTARHTATHPATAGRDWFDILFDNAYQHETELADRWSKITRTGMIQNPQQDFAAMLDTIADAAQHALNDYTATTRDTIAHPESPGPGLDRPGGIGLDL